MSQRRSMFLAAAFLTGAVACGPVEHDSEELTPLSEVAEPGEEVESLPGGEPELGQVEQGHGACALTAYSISKFYCESFSWWVDRVNRFCRNRSSFSHGHIQNVRYCSGSKIWKVNFICCW